MFAGSSVSYPLDKKQGIPKIISLLQQSERYHKLFEAFANARLENKKEDGSRYYPSVEQILYFYTVHVNQRQMTIHLKKILKNIIRKTLETIVHKQQLCIPRQTSNQISNIDISIHLIILSSYINKDSWIN